MLNHFYKIAKELLNNNLLNISNIQSKILEFLLEPNIFYNNVIHKLGINLYIYK